MNWKSIAPLILFMAGCQSSLTGNEGNLVFSYTADDQIGDFNKPIGIGASLDVRVATAGSRLPVTITSVTSTNPEVLEVVNTASGSFTLQGIAAGDALIEVEADGPDGTVTDSVNMLAAAPDVVKLYHTCEAATTRTAYYSSGAQVIVPYDLERTNGQAVIGYGLFPVEFAPSELATLDETSKDQANLHLTLGAAGELTISSALDDESLTLTLVDNASIDGASINPLEGGEVVVFEGETRFVHVFPTVDGNRLCQSTATMTAVSATPEICTASASTNLDETDLVNETLWLKVEAKAFGICLIDVTFPEGADGVGATTQLEVSVAQKP